MKKNSVIHFISASDRINYGDLLFPIIFQQELFKFKNIYFENYGMVRSDLSKFGGLKTKSFRQLEKNIQDNDKIVIGGGEVLFVQWNTLYGYIHRYFFNLLRSTKVKRIEMKFSVAQRILSKNKILFPFVFDESDFRKKKLKIYYNSVGGGAILKKNTKRSWEGKKRLDQARLISVRDNRTFRNLTDFSPRLVPDSALLMSDYFDKKFLSTQINADLSSDYIFLQVSNLKKPKDIAAFSKKVIALANGMNCKVVLCPIGLAAGHDDHIFLKKLYGLNPDFIFIMPRNIYEIMGLIAFSKVYLGTSLHGAITAMSYLVPAIGLNRKVHKLESYMRTWVSTQYSNLDFHEISFERINQLIDEFNTNYSNKKLKFQKKLVVDNISFIIKD